jgi:hypothetical protein
MNLPAERFTVDAHFKSITAMLDRVYPMQTLEPLSRHCDNCGDEKCRLVQAMSEDLKKASCREWRPE